MRSSFANRLQGVLVLIVIALTIWGFLVLPLDVPLAIHWDINGDPDGFAPAPVALLLPLVLVALLIGLFWFIDSRASPEQRETRRHITTTVITLGIGIAAVIQVITIMSGLGAPLNIGRLVALTMAVLFVVLGNALPKSRRNLVAGIRIPPTLDSDANWLATQRFGGWLYVVAGVLLGLAAVVTDNQAALILSVIAAAVIPAIAATVYSYRYGR